MAFYSLVREANICVNTEEYQENEEAAMQGAGIAYCMQNFGREERLENTHLEDLEGDGRKTLCCFLGRWAVRVGGGRKWSVFSKKEILIKFELSFYI